VSVAEVGGLGTWQHAVLGLTAAGADAALAGGDSTLALLREIGDAAKK
jgi:hypothetical protein